MLSSLKPRTFLPTANQTKRSISLLFARLTTLRRPSFRGFVGHAGTDRLGMNPDPWIDDLGRNEINVDDSSRTLLP